MSLGRKLCLALLAGLLGAASLSAQDPTGTVSGRVVEGTSREPLPGAAVSVGARTAVSGQDGRFTITGVPAGTQTVRATRIGYGAGTATVAVAAGQTATVEISMSTSALQLEGLVVIGYGTQQVRDRTGAVESVTPEEFNTGRVISAEQLIQGKVAGVQVIDSGEPGGGINLRIRGGTSVNASSEPLFVVDGVPLDPGGGATAGCDLSGCKRNPLNFLNPADIASVTVLKDASSTAIYGSRGANGVVLIETRRGTSGGPQFSYTSSVSRSDVTGRPDLLAADQFRQAVQQQAPENLSKLGTASTDWRSLVERDAMGQEHSLAVAGANGPMDYRLSLNYLDQEGVVRGSETERLSGSLSYSHRLFDDRLTVRANLKGARTEDQFTPGGVLGSATAFAPTQPITTGTGAWFEWAEALGANNPIAELQLLSDRGTTYRSVGNLEAQYRMPFLETLQSTVRVGYDVTSAERAIFSPTMLQSQLESPVCIRTVNGTTNEIERQCATGTVERRTPSQTHTVVDAFLNYTQPLDRWDSDVDVTAGWSYEHTRGDFPSFVARGLSSDLLGAEGVPGALQVQSFLDVQEHKLASGFARVNYSLADRYLLTLSVRRDGSSRFGEDNRWGTFPSAAVAWRLIDEPFMQGNGWLSDLKLRGSWGKNGNQAFGNYLAYVTYQIGTAEAQYLFGNDWITTIRPSAVDPDIRWEETTSWNIGLDYGLLDGRVTGAIEYYVKDTDDLIFSVPVAAGTNLSNFVTTNIGSMRNRGVELSLNAQLLDESTAGFSWDASFNAAYNRNRLLSINTDGGSEQILTGGIAGGVGNNIQVLQPGYEVNSFFVYRHKRDASGNPIYDDVNDDGTIDEKDLYEDLNDDGNVNQSDRAPYEGPSADWTLGHSSTLRFRSVDLSFALRANLGNYVYNNVASNLGHYDALRGGAPSNLHASALENNFQKPQYFSDVYVEDASFLRMDNLTLGYTFGEVRALRAVRDARVFGTVQNVFTWTPYTGVDPTAGLNGIDNNIYPRSRTFSAGITLGF